LGYADDTEFAAQNLIGLTMREEGYLTDLRAQLATEMGRYQANQWGFTTSDLNDDFSDAHVTGAFVQMARAKQEVDLLAPRIAQLEASIGSRQAAVQALCGALFQLARQGISFVHGNGNPPANCPDGRLIAGLKLKDVIWQARNQAMHFEELPKKRVIGLFAVLSDVYGVTFDLSKHPRQSRAKQVVKLLGWEDYSRYHSDVKSLGL
jgi:hypothetical protein